MAGRDGVNGTNGLPGVAGAQGPIGPQGIQGIQGEIGPQGPTGATGATGSSVLNGPTGPTASEGKPGDFWVDTSSKILYGPKGTNAWPESGVLLVGATGATGATGPKGETGAPGATGAMGAPGANGSVGAQGQQGPTGPNIVSNSTTTNLTGLLKGTGSAVTTAVPGTDYLTSIGLTVPSILSVSNSPLTADGSLTLNLAAQTANTVFAGPGTNGPSAPTFRKLSTSDISPQWYATASGSVNVYGVTLTPAATSLTTGLEVNFKPNLANTSTTPTLNLDSLGAITIVKLGNAPLAVGDLSNTAIAKVVYDGINWQLLNPQTSTNGTVTNVTASPPLLVATGSTTPAITISQADATHDGYLNSIDWIIFNNKGGGTVTSLAVSGLPLAISNSTTTPTISMNGTWADSQVADNLTISGGTVDNTIIGASTPAAGMFTSLKVTVGASPGKVLKSDVNGGATWQDDNVGGGPTVYRKPSSTPLTGPHFETGNLSINPNGETTSHAFNPGYISTPTCTITIYNANTGELIPGGGFISFDHTTLVVSNINTYNVMAQFICVGV